MHATPKKREKKIMKRGAFQNDEDDTMHLIQ